MKLKSYFHAFVNLLEYKKANRSLEGKRKYLEKRGAIIGVGTRLNCSTDSFGTEPYLGRVSKIDEVHVRHLFMHDRVFESRFTSSKPSLLILVLHENLLETAPVSF